MPRRHAAAALLLAAALAALPLRGDTFNVSVGGSGFSFTPQTLHIHTGDTVVWMNAGGFHSVDADDGSFGIDASSSAWTFSHTFTAAGTVGYHCAIHGAPGSGMFGTVIVEDAGGGGGGSHPGTLRFSLSNYAVSEAAGTATLSVQRVSGDDGAVSVQYAATAGTATAGQDFTPASGTLTWGDKDDAAKTFTVTVLNDSTPEPTETVHLALSNPTGGATLDPTHNTAILSIQDNDSGGGGGGPVSAPSNLQANGVSTSEIDLTWTDNSNNETGFQVERRTIGGTDEVVAITGPNATSAAVTGLDPDTLSVFRVRANGSGTTVSAYTQEVAAATFANPAPCVADTNTLCLTGGRFQVTAVWRTAKDLGQGFAVPLPAAPASGLFYFFDPTNIEMLIKVLNACALTSHKYWVFFAATTNVEFGVLVTDTQTGKTKGYFNPLNRIAAPVQDTGAFATCP